MVLNDVFELYLQKLYWLKGVVSHWQK